MSFRHAFVVLLVACGGKIAPDTDAGLAGTCGKHASSVRANDCTSTDAVTCTTGTYVVSCACGAKTCTCSKDGNALRTVDLAGCTSCAPTPDALFAVYAACGFPY